MAVLSKVWWWCFFFEYTLLVTKENATLFRIHPSGDKKECKLFRIPPVAYLSCMVEIISHVTIAAGRRWKNGALYALFRVRPEAISSTDPITNLFPFMLSATCDSSGLDTTYGLLRHNPSLLMSRSKRPMDEFVSRKRKMGQRDIGK